MNSSKTKQKSSESILLPRGYLSPSALDLWETSQPRYIRKYFYGEDIDRENVFMSFGKKVALYLEKGEFADDPVVVFAANMLPRFGNHEHEQKTVLKTAYGDITLLGKFDDFSPELVEILEHKTGKTVWTKARVYSLLQLRFYAVICNNEFGKVPRQRLTWVEVTDRDKDGNKLEKIRPTGHTDEFEFIATPEIIEETKRRIINACLGIDRAYRAYLKEIENA